MVLVVHIKCIVPVSGGKDSQACVKLAVNEFGNESVEGLFCDTQFEHPITYKHIDDIGKLYGIKINKICAGSVREKILKYKRFPGGGARFCTDELKIKPTKLFLDDFSKANGGFQVWYGMRADESSEREKRYSNIIDTSYYAPNEINRRYPKYLQKQGVMFRLPIVSWTEYQVFDYLKDEINPLYKAGFGRVGCFPCLAAGDHHKEKAFAFDLIGRQHLAMCRELEPLTGHSIYTSKRGQLRHDSGQIDCFEGCGACSI